MRADPMSSSVAANPLAQARKTVAEDPGAAYELILQNSDAWLSVSSFMSAVQLLQRIPSETREQRAKIEVKVALLGNCTLSYTADALSLALGPTIFPKIYTGDFDQWAMDLIDTASGLANFAPDVVVVHLSSLGFTKGGTDLAAVPIKQIEDAFRSFADRSNAPVITILPEPLRECTGGSSQTDCWYNETREAIRRASKHALGNRAITLDAVPTLLAMNSDWAAARYWNSAKIPLHPKACIALGRRLARVIENVTYPRIKVIAVDCDNTLWGGIVGEDGSKGLRLSPFDESAGYLNLQRLLKEAAANGFLLVALSKNDEENVREVFDQRPEMILKLEDFSLLKINWGPKSQNLLAAANELNLALDSFLLIDDSPFERGEVAAALPDVVIAELPPDPDEYATAITRLGLLERPLLSDEDTRRTELYRQEQARQTAREDVISPEEFLRDLQLEVLATPVGAENLDRVAQLVAKTNQFNLTTRRHSRDKLGAWASDPNVYAYCYRVSDRFGDAGITGVCVALPKSDRIFELDTLLLSCRVIGRTVEHAIMEHLRQWLADRKPEELRGEYLPTPKNGLVADLLPRFGFTLISNAGDRKQYSLEDFQRPIANAFAKIVEDPLTD